MTSTMTEFPLNAQPGRKLTLARSKVTTGESLVEEGDQ